MCSIFPPMYFISVDFNNFEQLEIYLIAIKYATSYNYVVLRIIFSV